MATITVFVVAKGEAMPTEKKKNSSTPAPEKSHWWRTVLGEYPTGVTLITSLDQENQPVGMVVGTFAAVSQDPPMIGFMPNTDSSTYPSVAGRGRFVANVLGAAHEELCRAFSHKSPERFDLAEWIPTESGIPRLANAVAWFDGTIAQTHIAGDHFIVVATVNDFGVGDANAGLPLLFLRGGYGSFTVPSLEFDVQGYARQLRIADALREPLREFADKHDVEIALCGLSGDTVVVLHALNIAGGVSPGVRPVGSSFPFAAPIGVCFATWGTDDTVKLWMESARHLMGSVDRSSLIGLIENTRERGFGLSLGRAAMEDFVEHVNNPDSQRADLARLWKTISDENRAASDLSIPETASSIQVPIFDASGRATLVAALAHFEQAVDAAGADSFAQQLRVLSRELTDAAGGRMPTLQGSTA